MRYVEPTSDVIALAMLGRGLSVYSGSMNQYGYGVLYNLERFLNFLKKNERFMTSTSKKLKAQKRAYTGVKRTKKGV